MNQLMYMKDVFDGRLVPVGQELKTINGPGTYSVSIPKENVEIALVGPCSNRDSYSFLSSEALTGTNIPNGGISIDIQEFGQTRLLTIHVSEHPFYGLPEFPLKVVTKSTTGQTISELQHISSKIEFLEPKQITQQHAYLVIKKNTLNCASENLSAYMSKDEAYKEALSLTRAAKDNKFLFDVEEVSIRDKIGT